MSQSEVKKIPWLKLGAELVVVFLGVTAGFLLQNLKDSAAEKKNRKGNTSKDSSPM